MSKKSFRKGQLVEVVVPDDWPGRSHPTFCIGNVTVMGFYRYTQKELKDNADVIAAAVRDRRERSLDPFDLLYNSGGEPRLPDVGCVYSTLPGTLFFVLDAKPGKIWTGSHYLTSQVLVLDPVNGKELFMNKSNLMPASRPVSKLSSC